jgi:hypothetical protein
LRRQKNSISSAAAGQLFRANVLLRDSIIQDNAVRGKSDIIGGEEKPPGRGQTVVSWAAEAGPLSPPRTYALGKGFRVVLG